MIESICLVTSLHLVLARSKVKTCKKKGQQKKIFSRTLNKTLNYPLFQCKKVLHFTFPLKICTLFKGIME